MAVKLKSLSVCGLLLCAVSSAAQTEAPGFQGREAGNLFPNSMPISISSAFIPQSLEELIAGSKLIVEVTVISAFPTNIIIERRGAPVPPISTDFVVEPQRVLKGQFAADRFVVNQLGGQVEDRASGRSRTVTYYSSEFPGGLMRPGQRYILFLSDDRLPGRPERDELKRLEMRFSVASVVRVEQGKVELSSVLPFRDSYKDKSAAQFMEEIVTKAPLIGPYTINSKELERLGIINSGAK